jgi:hypothetical protein
MTNKFTEDCLNYIKKDDVKNEIKKVMWSVISIILCELRHYIYFTLIFVMTTFLMILTILVILIQIFRNKNRINYLYK